MERMQRFTRANHQGVVSWASSVAYADLSEVMAGLAERGVDPLVIVLDRVTDVRNVGAIARSCESFGAHTIVLSEGSAPMNADAVKSSAGALLNMPICRVRSLPITLTSLEMSGCKIVGISEKATGTLADCDLRGPLALIMGSEENGISPALWKACNETAKIPTSGETASLNVSVALGIALYEVSMQRRA
jgi:23S rRNA (guanosine2251-2'-O)-methyltransferase